MAQAFNPYPRFAVGKYDVEYPGYRKVTADEWINSDFQFLLVQAHREGGGWALFENPLECNEALSVAEGVVKIDGELVVEVGYTGSQQLRGVYSAMNRRTQVAWTTTAPALGENWDVKPIVTEWMTTKTPAEDDNLNFGSNVLNSNPPCLYTYNFLPAFDRFFQNGSNYGRDPRKSRSRKQRKRSKRARKQKKKGTKKR